MTTAELELLSVFAPTSPPKPKDPYNGFDKATYEAREVEKKAIRKRQRANKALAADPQTPNRETWCCCRCFTPIVQGEPFYMHYDAGIMFATMKCQDCHEAMATTDPAPFRQATMIREVL